MHNSINTSDFNYDLSESRIAKFPLDDRSRSRLLVYRNGNIHETHFSSIEREIPSGSHIFFNNTRVIHARLQFKKASGAGIEIFCLAPREPREYQLAFSQTGHCVWECLIGNSKKWKKDSLVMECLVEGQPVKLKATRTGSSEGSELVEFSWDQPVVFGSILDIAGQIPIPPYLKRPSAKIDSDRYQTVYSDPKGSVAAPTAGLHFTSGVLDTLTHKGIDLNYLTLHVGAGTFKPLSTEDARDHQMHSEWFSVDRNMLKKLCKGSGPVIATGTTSLRTLESLYWLGVKSIHTGKIVNHLEQWEYDKLPQHYTKDEAFAALSDRLEREGRDSFSADTGIMIIPGYSFRVVEGLVTNFHQPKSTLLLLIAAFIGDDWKMIYDFALDNDFRFLSYGDSSLLWR